MRRELKALKSQEVIFPEIRRQWGESKKEIKARKKAMRAKIKSEIRQLVIHGLSHE